MDNLRDLLYQEKILKTIRYFFTSLDFHEVVVPMLNDAVPLEPNIHPFATTWETARGKKTFYLSTSPERGLKKALSLGIGNCFSIAPSFRNLEDSGTLHKPEFLMLEWYRENADYAAIMEDVKHLYGSIKERLTGQKIPDHDWPAISLTTLFKKYLELDLQALVTDDRILFRLAEKIGYQTKGFTWQEVYDQVFVNEIESHFESQPFFLVDFPFRISPLCKPQKGKPYLAERFEVYIKKMEIGNGNTENTDTRSIKAVFENEGKKTGRPIDRQFLLSLQKLDGKSYAGVGIGIDRLSLILSP